MAGFPVPTRAENSTRNAANARKLSRAVPSDRLHRRHHLLYLWDPLNRHGEDRGKG